MPKIQCLCEYCDKQFKKERKDYNRANHHFCSKRCYYENKKGKQPEHLIEARKTFKKKEYFCSKCNISLGLGWENCRKTCDNCNSNIKDWSKITILDLKTKYDLNQFHARIRALSRTTYKNSNKPKKCCNCGYSTHYEVCHIKDVKDFNDNDSIAKVNCIDNLVGLCRNCHWEFDNGILKLS